jgi:hypothetical protein
MLAPRSFLPVEIVFHPSWWHRHYGLKFDEAFFFDPVVRAESERVMRAALHRRFGDLGLGEAESESRPVVGPVHLAAGFLSSAVLGCRVRYYDDASPEALPANLTDDEVLALEPPDLDTNPVFAKLIGLMDSLESQYGSLEGDVNWEGVQNVALNLRGSQLFADYYENPQLARRILDVVAQTVLAMASYMRRRTGSTSLAVNRVVGTLNAPLSLHSNCTVAMVSANTYRQYLLEHDKRLARELWPYGIHHCGTDMHRVRHEYAQVEGAEFFDVGWGSDVRACRDILPDAILSLRLNPVRVSTLTADEVAADVEGLLLAAGPLERAVLCCINLDDCTPDENVRAIFAVVERYRKYGA